MNLNLPCSPDDLKKIRLTKIKEYEKEKETKKTHLEQKINSLITYNETQRKSISNLETQFNEFKKELKDFDNDIRTVKNNPENKQIFNEIKELKEFKQKLLERIKQFENRTKQDSKLALLELEKYKNDLKKLDLAQRQILDSITKLNNQVNQISKTQNKIQQITQSFESKLANIEIELCNPDRNGYFRDPEKLLTNPTFQRFTFSSFNLEDNYVVIKTLFDTNISGFKNNLFKECLEKHIHQTNLVVFYKFGTKFVMKRLFLKSKCMENENIYYGEMKAKHYSVINDMFIYDLEFKSNGSVNFLVTKNSEVYKSIDERKLIDFLENQTIAERICLFCLETKDKFNSKHQKPLTKYFTQLKKNTRHHYNISNEIYEEITYHKKSQLDKYISSKDTFIFVSKTKNGKWNSSTDIYKIIYYNNPIDPIDPIDKVFVFKRTDIPDSLCGMILLLVIVVGIIYLIFF
ncbi:hypothetical protein ENUP19_0127G0013 [Entamoeba nuttalli]|uniref:Uncharacterized protein n=2 Tax=Entamoeba nuttalli TaxID=412467 RepID=K2H6M0_ENTNP|nr:hypothetical protein ENU1_031060 [Entamoeba nuttalli P19]EKE42142.1 hypothetical protein ENU1_031060 [Entamoeba nuttalli P19]|eukprot:XP_008855524.1 hypothetical protein ENU1_031060 [Entamoeba nuttalli P19]